jgi:archaemetzincin
MGAVELQVLLGLQRELEEALATEVRAGETMELPRDAYDPKRRQYRATVLLAALAPAGDERVLGVADVDLYVRGLNFVFGLADALSRRAVIALPRLRTAPGAHAGAEVLFLERVTKEAAHELGHTYGLSHCSDRRCAMAFSNSLAEVDAKGRGFCARCRRVILRSPSSTAS